jgi:hypothetical protein
MLELIKGDIFTSGASIIGITTNGMLNNKKHLVMGKGVALAASKKFPKLGANAGNCLINRFSDRNFELSKAYYYGWLVAQVVEDPSHYKLGLFQTKLDWKQPSTLEVIENSCNKLDGYITTRFNLEYKEGKFIALPVPGVGCGGLGKTQVLDFMDKFPWSYPTRLKLYEL